MKHFSELRAKRMAQPLRRLGLLLGLSPLTLPLLAQPTVTGVSPARNQPTASRSSNVSFTLSQPLNAGSGSALRVFGGRRGGLLTGTASVSGNTVTFDPAIDFQSGETVYATLTTAAQNTSNQPLAQGHVMSFMAAASNGSAFFTPAPSFTVPTNGQGAVVGDLNNDGLMDVVIGTGSNTLLTFIGTGGGTFAAPVSVATGSGPSQIVLADLDNDGDLDAAVPSFGSNVVSVHRNVGGVLGAATSLATGSNPRNVAAVDVDGDGDLDILTGNTSSNNVTLNRNSAGVFAAATTVASVGSNPYGLGVADFNGDGKMDFATADANGSAVSVRLGVGDGTFTTAASLNMGATPFGIAVGDLNGDNIADLVTCNRFGTTVAVALGIGNGAFNAPATVTVGTEPIDINLADVDADGDLDLIVGNFGNATLSVCRNSGTGTFPAVSSYATGTQTFVVTSGDLDGDGSLDIVAANIGTTSVTVLRNGALPDLVVSTTANIPPGGYNSITVTGTGVGTVTGAVSVATSFTVQPGGVLNTNCQSINGPGNFTLQPGAELRICDVAGITGSGATGAVQVTGTRTFSNDASYTYNGTAAQVTGAALPSRVRDLEVTNGTGVTLSTATSVAQVLRLTAGVLTTNARVLTLLSDATGTALAVNIGGSVTGTVTVQRYISPNLNAGLGYRHYAAPVTNTTVGDLATTGPTPFTPVLNAAYNNSATPGQVTPFPTVYGYDESRILTSPATGFSAFDKGWFSPADGTAALQSGLGYTVNIAASEKVDFVGTLGNGAVARTLTRTGGAQGGLNLVGNPYPSPLNWSQVTIPAGLDNAMYVYQSTAQYAGGYRSYINGFGDPLVSSSQGFFVRVTPGSTTATLTFTNAARVTTFATQPTFNRTAEARPVVQLRLQAQGGTLTDDAYVYQQAGATAGIDAAYDAVKLLNPHGLNLASVASGSETAINGLPVLTTATVVPLSLSVPQAGTYTINAVQLLNLAQGTVYLHDDLTSQDVNLSQQPTYSFQLSGKAANRFSLRFGMSQATATHASQLALATSVYPIPAHGGFTVQLPGLAQGGKTELVLLNALGQLVYRQQAMLSASGTTTTVAVPALASGVYTLQVRLGTEVVSKRVVLN